jgi:ribosome-associated protein
MAVDLSTELLFRTARSGGKGGQNVNKVETAAEAVWHPATSGLFGEEDKARILHKLSGKLNKEGFLAVKSTEARGQLENKAIAQKKLEALIEAALIRPKPRKKVKPTRAMIEKRLEGKRKASFKKEQRRKDW